MTDWREIIFDLKKAGFSEETIAGKVGWHVASVNRLKNGDHEPRHSVGQALLKLHERVKNAGLIGCETEKLG